MGVGPEQNFTYIVATKPAMAFIVDIRRGNLDLQLMYKALFELSADRAEFVSRLFSKKRPEGLTAKSTRADIFAAYRDGPSRPGECSTTTSWPSHNLLDPEARLLRFPTTIWRGSDVYNAFFPYGPKIQYLLDQLSFGRLAPADLRGSDDGGQLRPVWNTATWRPRRNFQFLKDLESRNMLVPVIGNFGGPKAIRAVGQYLEDRDASSRPSICRTSSNISARISSANFCANVATLPLKRQKPVPFIRSVRRGNATPGIGLSSELGTMLSEVELQAVGYPSPTLLVLFVGSGCAALIYEIVWFQLLHFIVGVSAVSFAIVLGTFMGGMCAAACCCPGW